MTTTNMAGKTVIITGATNGIGKETTLGLARMGAHVVLVGRDERKGAAVVSAIKQQSGNSAIDFLRADLSVQAEVRALAEQILARYPRIDVLINNAGGVFGRRQITADGIEQTFAFNHLAYFLLTNLLLDRIVASAPARIVNVSSAAHYMAPIKFDDLQGQRHYSGFRAYSQSKLANLMFSNELARRLAGTGVTVNAVHPGAVATGFAQGDAGLWGMLFSVFRPFMRTPAQGAQTSIFVASAPELAGATGMYFADQQPAHTSRAARDRSAAQRLWQISAQMTGLQG